MAGNLLYYVLICAAKRARKREKKEKEFFYLDVANSILTHKTMYEIQ